MSVQEMKLTRPLVHCLQLKTHISRLLSTPMRPLTMVWFKCQVETCRWTSIKNALTSRVTASSMTPLICSKWWLTLLSSPARYWLQTSLAQRIERPTIYTSTYTSTTPSVKTKICYCEQPTATTLLVCQEMVLSTISITSMLACSSSSSWTTSHLRNAWLSLVESRTIRSMLTWSRRDLVNYFQSQNINTSVVLQSILEVNTEHGQNLLRPTSHLLSSQSPGKTRIWQHSMLPTLLSVTPLASPQVDQARECTAVPSQTWCKDTILLTEFLASTPISLIQVYSAWLSKVQALTHRTYWPSS